jgi:REP element-mobilizing transposase RayT
MILSERRLPHLYAIGQPLFITFCLHGSHPAHRVFPSANLTSGEAFAAMDRLLDHARTGRMFFGQPEIARVVMASIDYGAGIGHYEMHAWVIMSNHVHLLLTPHINVSTLLCSLKRSTARRANLLLTRTGQAFWQDESYDHVVRNREEFRRIRRYIEYNPVRACLVTAPEKYPYSSAGRPTRPPQAASLPH